MGFTDETWLEGLGRFRCRLLAQAASGYALRALREQITSSEQPPSYYFGNAKLDTMKNHTSEGNIFVGDFRASAGMTSAATVGIVSRGGMAFEVIAATRAGTSTFASPSRGSTFGAATEHPEVVRHDFEAGALLAFLILPFAGLNAA